MPRPNRCPVAPGVYILEELSARGKTIADLQHALNVNSATMLCLLDGRSSVAPLATNLAQFFGTSETLWRRLQEAFDWWKRSDE